MEHQINIHYNEGDGFASCNGKGRHNVDSACSNGATECEAQPKDYSMPQTDANLEDLFFSHSYSSDDNDDDDIDWEPASSISTKKWFCVNCTMSNFDITSHCDMCGVEKDYELTGYEIFQRQIEQASQAFLNKDNTPSTLTAIGFDERMLLHYEIEMKSHPHPERPDRLRAIAASLAAAGFFPSKCFVLPPREITKDELLMVHTPEHIDTVEVTKNLFYSYFTSDTYANGHSACAARIAAGLCADLASSIMSGQARNGFALVRPPGHHACVKQAMGFCLHNNAAVAALAAQRAGAKRVLIVDWDVHHGNGTQEIFERNKSVLYISLHRHEGGNFYPGTGAADEVGIMDGEGFSVNIPWSCGGVGDNDYIFAFKHVVIPICLEFQPDITIISAGFDAARGDPLGCCDVTPDGYAQMTSMLSTLSKGKLLVILEGGYNLQSISSSVVAVAKVLVGDKPIENAVDIKPSKAGIEAVVEVLRIQKLYWSVLASTHEMLLRKWCSALSRNGGMPKKRRRLVSGPLWWMWGSKRFAYKLLYGRKNLKRIKFSRS